MKNILLLFILSIGFSTIVSAQYADIQGAVSAVNEIAANSPTACAFKVSEKGEAEKQDLEFTDVIYEFNLNDVEMIVYEQEGPSHRVKFVCASGNKCFHCEKNHGGGVFHFLEVNSKDEAEKVVAAFKYIKQQIVF